jgi:hypothetical protein
VRSHVQPDDDADRDANADRESQRSTWVVAKDLGGVAKAFVRPLCDDLKAFPRPITELPGLAAQITQRVTRLFRYGIKHFAGPVRSFIHCVLRSVFGMRHCVIPHVYLGIAEG